MTAPVPSPVFGVARAGTEPDERRVDPPPAGLKPFDRELVRLADEPPRKPLSVELAGFYSGDERFTFA